MRVIIGDGTTRIVMTPTLTGDAASARDDPIKLNRKYDLAFYSSMILFRKPVS
jgi:hypothetical protein